MIIEAGAAFWLRLGVSSAAGLCSESNAISKGDDEDEDEADEAIVVEREGREESAAEDAGQWAGDVSVVFGPDGQAERR